MCEKQQVKPRERYRMFCVLVAVQEDERYRMFCVLYECGTWYVTEKEEHVLSVLENTVLRETCGSKGKEGTRGSSSSSSSLSWSVTN